MTEDEVDPISDTCLQRFAKNKTIEIHQTSVYKPDTIIQAVNALCDRLEGKPMNVNTLA